MSKVKVVYKDIAIGASDSFAPSTSQGGTYFSKIEQITNDDAKATYSNPYEEYSTLLDGSSLPLPSKKQDINVGYWSEEEADDIGVFSEQQTIQLISSEKFTTNGITIDFGNNLDIVPAEMLIVAYRDGVVILSERVYPKSSIFFYEKRIEAFNKITFSIPALNTPHNRLKIKSIVFGKNITLQGEDLTNVSVMQKCSVLSTEIPIGTTTLDIKSKNEEEYFFQERQPIEVYFLDKLKSVTFVTKSTNKAPKIWAVQTEDYIGLLEDSWFFGGVYTNKNAVDLMTEIFNTAKVPFKISSDLSEKKVSGYIPYSNCREALMQVAFAIGASVSCADYDYVKVFELVDDIKRVIGLERIMEGQTVQEEGKVTEVRLTSHKYIKTEEIAEIYKNQENAKISNTLITFSEPYHSLSITNGSILSSGETFAIINANVGCVLSGKKYKHETRILSKKNPLTLSNSKENVKAISKATLISDSNVDNILSMCYNYYSNSRSSKMKIIENEGVLNLSYYGASYYGDAYYGENNSAVESLINLGEKISVKTKHSYDVSGFVSSQKFNLNGGGIVKEIEIRGGS